MCTCRLSLSYLSWENMQIWNIRFPAFMAPYKLAELQRLRRPETRVKLLFFVNSRLLLPKKSSQLEMYVILSTFSIKCTLEVWLDVRVFPGFVLSVPSLHCMYSQLWGVIGEMVPKNVVPWIVYVFGPLVPITDGFLLPVEHFNFRVVEFRSVKMLSNSRRRDVFQIRAGES